MKHKLTSIVIVLALCLSLVPMAALPAAAAEEAPWEGTGAQANPYLISTAADLQALATNVNDGTSYSDKYFKMTTDIDLSDVCGVGKDSWTPIGRYIDSNDSGNRAFSGTFDGDGHIVTGL